MGKKNNRKCIICGKTYTFCPVCNSEDTNKPSWYFIFDGVNCHDIYDVCVTYRDNEITPKEAYDKLSKLDIKDYKDFVPATKEQIEEILEKGKHSKIDSEKLETNSFEIKDKSTKSIKSKNKVSDLI
nr:MAG TPA: hypothetical protein [Caudoviricetes sp.]